MEGDKTVTRRLKRLAPALRDPAVQLILKLALAIMIVLLYAGHQGAKHGPQLLEFSNLPRQGPGAEAAFVAPLGAGLLTNALFPRPQAGEHSQELNLVNWLIGLLTLFIAGTVGWNWLQDATTSKGWQYVRPILVYTGAIATIVLLWIGAIAGISRLKNKRPG